MPLTFAHLVRQRPVEENVHLHFHTFVLDGVLVREADGPLRFHPASPPTDDDVHRVAARVRQRLERLGLAGATVADEDADPLADYDNLQPPLPLVSSRVVRAGGDPALPLVGALG